MTSMFSRFATLGAGAAILALCPSLAHAEDPEAKLFGSRPQVSSISISPDGKTLAIIQPTSARGSGVYIARTDGQSPQKVIVTSSGGSERLLGCDWSTNERLICNVYVIQDDAGLLSNFTRMIAVDSDGSDIKVLTAPNSRRAIWTAHYGGDVIDFNPGDASESQVYMTRVFVPENTVGTHLASNDKGLGVEVVDTVSMKRRTVEKPVDRAVGYISDGHGEIRLMALVATDSTGYATSEQLLYYYRLQGDKDWKPFDWTDDSITDFDPVAVDKDLNIAYAFARQNGRYALFSVKLDGSMETKLLLENEQVDIDGLIRIGRDRRVVGLSYATDRRYAEYFDEKLGKLIGALGNALPGQPVVTLMDTSAGERQLVFEASQFTEPATYYLFNKDTSELSPIMGAYEALDKSKLGQVKAITYSASDGTQIPGYLTLPAGSDGKNLPAIVMPHGGPSARDELGYDWLAQYFASKGYAVLQPNYRGSAGYGEDWLEDKGFQQWKVAIGDIDDGGKWLVSEGIAKPEHLAIVGWSYGGYAALQSGVFEPGLFKAIVAIAPVTDLMSLKNSYRYSSSYRLAKDFIGSGPHVREGSPAQNAEKISVPVLMFHGNLDLNVDIDQSELMASKLRSAGKNVEYIEYKDLDHYLIDSDVRAELLEKSNIFLRTSMGM